MKYTLTDKTITILEHIIYVAEKTSKIVQFCFIKGKKQFYINPLQDIFVTFELDEAIKFVLKTIKEAFGGEIFIPKIPSYRIVDVAKAINKGVS